MGLLSHSTRQGMVRGVWVDTFWSAVGTTSIFLNGHCLTAHEARELAEVLKGAAHAAELNERPVEAGQAVGNV